ncbi:MAG TPA: hypothetical protein VGO36_00580 [Solirubrobacterales bacterium]|jgi:sugar lactone lactonase YvrE|nr:hypothetical protein [Solirubrobacterales bacterium]
MKPPRIRRLCLTLAIALCAAGAFASSASAVPTYEYSSAPYAVNSKVAFDKSGNTWLNGFGGLRQYNAEGKLLLTITEGKFKLSATDFAFDSAGNVWAVDSGGERAVEFNSTTGAFIREFGELGSGNGQFYQPTGIAIDSSDNIWITDQNNTRVEKFNSKGEYLSQFGSLGTGNGQFTNPVGIRIDGSGNLRVLDSQVAGMRIQTFNTKGEYVSQVGSGQIGSSVAGNLAIDASGNNWVCAEQGVIVLSSGGTKFAQFGAIAEAEPNIGQCESTAFDAAGNLWVGSATHSNTQLWKAVVPAAPTVTTEPATGLKDTIATLNAAVDMNGGEGTYEFEYGPTAAYGNKATYSGAWLEGKTIPVAVSQTINGLTPSTTYHYRVVAKNSAGTATGSDVTFTTAATDVPTALAGMATTEPFDGSAGSLANFGANWALLAWTAGKGEDNITGWRPTAEYPTVNGAYLNQTLSDSGPGAAVAATMAVSPGSENRYFSLWLDMSNPAATPRNGYELRVTSQAGGTYKAQITKWSGGVPATLGTVNPLAFAAGSKIALTDQGSAVKAWADTGAGFKQVISATDSTYSSGKTGVEGASSTVRLTKFKAGAVLTPVENGDKAMRALTLRDAFATVENPLSRAGAWTGLFWGSGTGQNYANGWGPTAVFPAVNGANWTKASFPDTGAGTAVSAAFFGAPGVGHYFSIWLDMPTPGTAKTGYEFRGTELSPGNYEGAINKWQAGVKTTLKAIPFSASAGGLQFGLVDKGSTVAFWVGTGGGIAQYIQIASVADASFSSGFAGVEGNSNTVRLRDFRAGQLSPF